MIFLIIFSTTIPFSCSNRVFILFLYIVMFFDCLLNKICYIIYLLLQSFIINIVCLFASLLHDFMTTQDSPPKSKIPFEVDREIAEFFLLMLHTLVHGKVKILVV